MRESFIPPCHSYFNSRPSARGDVLSCSLPQPPCISIHAPPRGATIQNKQGCVFGYDFNSRPSARGDRGRCIWSARYHFNSRPSARGDANVVVSRGNQRRISIHAPPRGATNNGKRHSQRRKISIHAPPRGATALAVKDFSVDIISIHAPPRGATDIACVFSVRSIHFNSRPSARGDECKRKTNENDEISIHAPPRGATRHRLRFLRPQYSFQFTPLREGRHDTSRRVAGQAGFQFTPLREGRRSR